MAAYVSIRQQTAYVNIRQHTSAYTSEGCSHQGISCGWRVCCNTVSRLLGEGWRWIRRWSRRCGRTATQHKSQHMSAYVIIRQYTVDQEVCAHSDGPAEALELPTEYGWNSNLLKSNLLTMPSAFRLHPPVIGPFLVCVCVCVCVLGLFSEVSLIRDNQGKETVWLSKDW